MKNLGIKTAVIVAVLAIVGWQAQAANVMSVLADASPAFKVYNGYTGTLTYVVGSDTTIQTNTVTCDGNVNTYLANDALTNGTIALLAANVAASTNAAGTKSLKVNSEPSLAADVTIGTLLPGSYSAVKGAWLTIPWDTSECKFYSLYLRSRTYGAVGAYRIGKILGNPAGTGDLTLSVYKVGVLISQKVITSPVYVNPATLLVGGTNVSTNTLGIVAIVNLDEEVGIPASGSEAIIIRAARATTATGTAVLSATIGK